MIPSIKDLSYQKYISLLGVEHANKTTLHITRQSWSAYTLYRLLAFLSLLESSCNYQNSKI